MDSKQTTKDVMTFWTNAVMSHESGNYVKCLELYHQIEEKSGRILYNMACAHIKLNQPIEAVKYLTKSVEKNAHSAIAFFQRGVLFLDERRLEEAKADFNTAHLLLRDNTFINYKQLGMRCKLHLCEVLYNKSLVYILKGDKTRAEKILDKCHCELEYKHMRYISTAQKYMYMQVEELKTAAFEKSMQTSTSPLMAVRRFLKNPGARRNRTRSHDQPAWKGSVSMTDLRARYKKGGFFSESLPVGGLLDLHKIRLDMQRSTSLQSLDDNQSHKRERRVSSGSSFGTTSSLVSSTLSSSFDTLTALVVPDIRNTDINTDSISSNKESESQRISSSSYLSLDSIDDYVTDVFTDIDNVRKNVMDNSDIGFIHMNASDRDENQSKFVHTFEESLNSPDNKTQDAISKHQSHNSVAENRSLESNSPRRRKIPPPPSYPPPPLPPNIVKAV